MLLFLQNTFLEMDLMGKSIRAYYILKATFQLCSKRAISIYTLTNIAHFPLPLLGLDVTNLLNCSYLTDVTFNKNF